MKYKVDASLSGSSTRCKGCSTVFELTDSSVIEQPFDPLAPLALDDFHTTPAPRSDPSASGVAKTATAAGWKNQVRKSKRNSAFGGFERGLIYLGSFMLLLGIIMNLLPIFGTQIAMFKASETTGQFVGLIFGLVGAGLVALSLRKFQLASMVSGVAGAVFVLVVYMASILGTGDRVASHGGKPANKLTGSGGGFVDAEIDQKKSEWSTIFPGWDNFENVDLRLSPADRWNRFAVGDTTVSASFLGEPKAGQGRIRINRTSVETMELTARNKGIDFYIGLFEFPGGKSVHQKLVDVELAIGEPDYSTELEFSGFAGRGYRVRDGSRSTHGKYFVVNKNVVHIRMTGPSSQMRDNVSNDFLGSVRFVEDAISSRPSAVPRFEQTAEQKTHYESIIVQIRKLEALMNETIHKRSTMNFAPEYLSVSAGKDSGQRRFMVHPGKLPVIGVDLLLVKTRAGTLISNLVPVYDNSDETAVDSAPNGYALAGINVNATSHVKGLQFVYMKVNPKGFDTSQVRKSQWYGTRPSGLPEKIGGDGRPVYGIWMCQKKICKSIGLIRESN